MTRYILLVIVGIVLGVMVAAGLFAFLTVVGVITRLAIRTSTANKILLYEDIVVVGALLGNIEFLFQPRISVGVVGLVIYGFFTGCFVGCLSMALEEVLQVFPIITRRIKLNVGIPVLVLILAISKGLGVFYQLFIKG